jgi:arylsulfatase A-like enzyme
MSPLRNYVPMKKKFFITAVILLIVSILLHVYLSYRSYNIILITMDTQRPDYLSCYNPQTPPTPNIDNIARHGVRFTRAFSLIPITMAAHTSIFTSHYPHEVRVFNNGDRFQHNYPMFTDLLERRGYTTAGFISLGVLGSTFGLAQGFNKYDDDFGDTGRSYKWASEVNAAAIPWLEKNKDRKFFAWLHYSDPHEPYIPFDAPPDTEVLINGKVFASYCIAKKEKIPLNFSAKPGENRIEFRALNQPVKKSDSRRFLDADLFVTPDENMTIEFGQGWEDIKLRTGGKAKIFEDQATVLLKNERSMPVDVQVRISGGVWENRASEIRKNYGKEVQFVDKHIGILWNKLSEWKLLNKTIIIIVADHGEGLKTHGILGHVDKLWNETTHIPLIIYYPWLGKEGVVSDLLVNQLDIMPTVLDLAHVRNKKEMEGYSLMRYLSRSPIDWIFHPSVNRQWTYACTYEPEATHNAFSITNGIIKVIHTPTKSSWPWEAYDLVKDPMEKRNLAKVDPERFREMTTLRGLLEAHRREAEAGHSQRQNPGLSEDEEEMLRTLGYVAGEEKQEGSREPETRPLENKPH